MKPRSKAGRSVLVLAAIFVTSLGMGIGTASADQGPTDTSLEAALATAKEWRDAAGVDHGIRALSADEVRARGLDKKIDMSKYRLVEPKVTQDAKPVGAVEASKESADDIRLNACWTHWFRSGISALYGQTDVSWCGDGTWVRDHASSNCWGSSSWPTYHYMGCNNYPRYGVNWNLYQVKTVWDLCPAWVPIWGACSLHDYPMQEWQYFGNGRASRIA